MRTGLASYVAGTIIAATALVSGCASNSKVASLEQEVARLTSAQKRDDTLQSQIAQITSENAHLKTQNEAILAQLHDTYQGGPYARTERALNDLSQALLETARFMGESRRMLLEDSRDFNRDLATEHQRVTELATALRSEDQAQYARLHAEIETAKTLYQTRLDAIKGSLEASINEHTGAIAAIRQELPKIAQLQGQIAALQIRINELEHPPAPNFTGYKISLVYVDQSAPDTLDQTIHTALGYISAQNLLTLASSNDVPRDVVTHLEQKKASVLAYQAPAAADRIKPESLQAYKITHCVRIPSYNLTIP